MARNCSHGKWFPGKKAAHAEEWKHRSLWCVKERVKPKTRVHGGSNGRRGWIYTEKGLELDALINRAINWFLGKEVTFREKELKREKTEDEPVGIQEKGSRLEDRRACPAWH